MTVVWTFDTFYYNFGIKMDFAKCLKESCCYCIVLVKISPSNSFQLELCFRLKGFTKIVRLLLTAAKINRLKLFSALFVSSIL